MSDPHTIDSIIMLRVLAERDRQRRKRGRQEIPAVSTRVAGLLADLEQACREECDAGGATWTAIAGEELGELARERLGTVAFEVEALQLAAVVVQAIEASMELRLRSGSIVDVPHT